KCLRCLQSWIQYGVPFEMLHLLIDHVIALFSIESMNDAATEVLVEFISQTRINYYQNTVCEKILQCMTGDWAKSQITKAINDGDELSARNLCRLMTTFGDNFTNYVAINFLRQDIVIYLEMMLMFAGFPGYFGQDQEISFFFMPLQFWFMLQESLCDPEVIPVISASDNDVSTSDIQTLNISPTNIQQIRESSIVIFRRLIEVLRGKVQYPPDSEWVEFTKELAISQISTPGRDQNQWQDLESTLFCIKSIAEAVSNGENIYLPQLFGSDVYGKLPVQGHTKLRNTAFSLIGSYADWFKSNPQYILSALNYLIPALSDIELALAAATAFKEVCDICRDSLVNGIEDLVNMYIPREKQKVIESIADVIQVLPPEKMVQPLLSITSDIIQTMKDIILHGRQNPSQFREIIITQLEYLTCCGRGIQPPDENLIVIDDDDLKTKQNFAVFDSIPVQDLTNALSEIIRNIAEIWYQDNEVIECLCKFLNIGIRITPNLLSIPFEIIVPLIKISFQRHPHANWLETAVQIVTVYGSSPKHGVDLMDVLISLTSTTIQHVRSKAGKFFK
ncbi:hypothetical protein RhiirA4_326975, partial [Rhizophagus irregularis]